MDEMKRFEFTITLSGYGKDKDLAWIDACENFCTAEGNWGDTPDDYKETGEILD